MPGTDDDSSRWIRHDSVSVDGARCVRQRWASAACDRCEQSCPPGAITFGPGVTVAQTCTGCGACVAACPQDAFSCRAGTEVELGDCIAAAAVDGVAPIACACAEAPAPAVLVACLGRLSTDALVRAASLGVRRIDVRTADCATCDQRDALRCFDESVELARCLATSVGWSFALDRGSGARRPARQVSAGRRGLLRALLQPVAAVLTTPRAFRRQDGAESRRSRLLGLLRGAAKPAESTPTAGYWPFGRVSVDPKACTACPVCERVCPTAALSRRTSAGREALAVDSRLCSACGACQDACPSSAIVLRPATLAELSSQAEAPALVTFAGACCPSCGQPSRGGPRQLCALCDRSHRRLRVTPE